MLSETLHGLRDVDDVVGSFLLAGDGRLLSRDLPAVFHGDVFADVGPRLKRLHETLGADARDASTMTLRFSEHKLHVRALGSLLLCVVTGTRVNAPALRMAMNLVARRVDSAAATTLLDQAPPTLKSESRSSAPPPSPASTREAPPPSTQRHEVLYRGRRTR